MPTADPQKPKPLPPPVQPAPVQPTTLPEAPVPQPPVTAETTPLLKCETKAYVGGAAGQVEVGKFAEAHLQGTVDLALQPLDGNVTTAIVRLERNATGLNYALLGRIGGHWSVEFAYTRAEVGWAAGTEVEKSWGPVAAGPAPSKPAQE